MSEYFCHPDQFVEELIRAAYVSLVEKLPVCIKNLLDRAEIHISKYGNESQFAQNRLEVLNRPSASKHAG